MLLNIGWHGDVHIACCVVPFELHAAAQGSFPICGDGVILLEGVHEVLGVLLLDALDSKVINTEAEPDLSGVMFP